MAIREGELSHFKSSTSSEDLFYTVIINPGLEIEMSQQHIKRVVIIGAGFGGLFAARTLAGKLNEVLLIDRNNFHTFTPLLYQVATCALDPSEIAYPVRGIFRKKKNIHCIMGEVTEIDKLHQNVTIEINGERRLESFDYLIIAAGSSPAYFGNGSIQAHTFELQSLADAVGLRNHILRLLERAAWTDDNDERKAMSTLVVVGGGPTGLETAGALFELYNHVIKREFGAHVQLNTRVILVEQLPHLLAAYPEKLRQAAFDQLISLGVEIILENPVTAVAENHIQLGNGLTIPTNTVIWTAGVEGSPAAGFLGIDLTKGNRIPVRSTLEVDDCQQIYAVGDNTYLEDPNGNPYPMLIPVATQQGVLAAKNILRHIQGIEQKPFQYYDRGIMATIGRSRAVAWIFNRISLKGYFAWIAWLFLHLLTLMGFRNQINVLVNWIWNYFTFDRSVRVILD